MLRNVWTPVLAWAALIFMLSSLHDLPGDNFLPEFSDKIAHVILYTVLGYFLTRAMRSKGGLPGRAPLAATFVLGVAYGLTDELHQAFVPGRTPDPADLLADAAGVAMGIFVYILRQKKSNE